MGTGNEPLEISEEHMEMLEENLSKALDHLRMARDRGIPEEYAEEAVEDAITETVVAWGRVQEHIEVSDE